MLPLPIFEYHKPRTLAEATGLLASLGDKAMILAGGTDVLPHLGREIVVTDIGVDERPPLAGLPRPFAVSAG